MDGPSHKETLLDVIRFLVFLNVKGSDLVNGQVGRSIINDGRTRFLGKILCERDGRVSVSSGLSIRPITCFWMKSTRWH